MDTQPFDLDCHYFIVSYWSTHIPSVGYRAILPIHELISGAECAAACLATRYTGSSSWAPVSMYEVSASGICIAVLEDCEYSLILNRFTRQGVYLTRSKGSAESEALREIPYDKLPVLIDHYIGEDRLFLQARLKAGV